ncbi:hypothetical protein [Haloferula sp.]|uniref:hypothetical protein n=1 Tax=Haloferula sp. TaxID=2497595 RepID=UPI003C74A0DA
MILCAARSNEPTRKLIIPKLALGVLAVLTTSTTVAQNPFQDYEGHQCRDAPSKATFMGIRKSLGKAEISLPIHKTETKIYSLYHIGSKNFFLDHQAKLTLSAEQIYALFLIRARSSSSQSSADLNIEYEEHQLWLLTSENQPNDRFIAEKVREIEKLRSARRLAFIHAVAEAVEVLTDQQQQLLTEKQATTKLPNPTGP